MATYSANKPDPYTQINPRTGRLFGEIPCPGLDEFNACQNYHHGPEEADKLCLDCNGSGEGMFEGTICQFCHGKGTV